MSITILNCAILTNEGVFSHTSSNLEEVKELINGGFQSAIGHQATSDVLTTLLGVEVPVNRIQYKQTPEDTAIVFKLNGRAPEGKILTVEEMEEMGYSFSIIKMLPIEQIIETI